VQSIIKILLSAVVVMSLSGCATAMLGGKSGTRFETSVQEVYDASLATLEADNLPILRKTIATNNAQIDSEFPNGTHLRIVIKETSPSHTRTDIRVGALGDDYRAYDLMRKIEDRVK
jgi:hypothetical protein